MLHREWNDIGQPIFGLYGVTKDGLCECLNPDCNAILKHPRVSNWQVTKQWDEEQMDCIEMTGQLDTGYGVLCNGLLVIDVDARNGGIESYNLLVKNIPAVSECEYIVETGSGGGSKHLYFRVPDGVKLLSHLSGYKGIDFKISGYVVGEGSLHKSGNRYKGVHGSPSDISMAPDSLVELLSVKEYIHSEYNGESLEISNEQIEEMLSFINPDCDHETWIRCGMAIHNATNGSGFNIWDKWSSKGSKYPNSDILTKRWESLGKSANVTTIGTLVHLAKECGYIHKAGIDDVEFISDINWGEVDEIEPIKKQHTFDPLNPPSLVGRIAKWINSRSMYPRENLAVAAALMAVSCAGGMRYRCLEDGICGNLFAFCVAGSGTGKESILQSFTLLLREAGIASAVHGNIKSEQEIFRNIIDHQASFYTVDEIGEMLAKIHGARQKSGSSSYLEGIFGALMGIYSKANGIQLITGDSKKAIKKELQSELSILMRKIDDNEGNEIIQNRVNKIKELLQSSDHGIENPYLNILGFTAPSKFSTLLDQDMADNGFFARALIFRELEDNPMYKIDYVAPSGEDKELKAIGSILSNMYHAGHTPSGRVELLGKVEHIPSSHKAKILFNEIRQFFWEMGESQKEREGMVAYTRRGAEMVSRIALILSMGEMERTEEHLMWAFELIKKDMTNKITITNSNSVSDKGSAILSKIMSHMSHDHGVSVAVLKNKIKNFKGDVIEKAIDYLISNNKIIKQEYKPVRGPASFKLFIA
jgi:hypothetical protein